MTLFFRIRNRFVILTVTACLGVGLLVASAASLFINERFAMSAERADGRVIELVRYRGRAGYRPTIEFETAEGTIRVTSGSESSPPLYRVGERITVFYDAKNPQSYLIDSFSERYLLSLIYGVLGIVFSSTGGIPLLQMYRRRRLLKELKSMGQLVTAHALRVELHESVTYNGRSPYRLVAQWIHPLNKKLYTFYSEDIDYDPDPYLNSDKVSVYIDPQNPKRNAMDISFLPKQA